jgi:hypothetical protein
VAVTRAETSPRWLLLAHQLPAGGSNARVKTWRRIQQLGAVPARNSVYVLPNTEQAREDFEWLRSEIVALGGEATVFVADAVNAGGADDIERAFHLARDADYDTIVRDAERLARSRRAARARQQPDADSIRAVAQLRERLAAVQQIDFCRAPRGPAAADAVDALERRVGAPAAGGKEAAMKVSVRGFVRRRWVTRPRPGVDRMASAWLIRRYIDPAATFRFSDKPRASEVAFDMYAGEFTHRGTQCTFEMMAEQFGIVDPAASRIGQIVHDLDMKENRYDPPEAPAVARLIDGLRQVHDDDAVLLEQGIAIFEALARSFAASEQAKPAKPRRPPARRTRARS